MKFIYILKNGDHFYKVGIANNVTRRIEAMRTGNPQRISLVCCRLVEDAEVVERTLHLYLDEHRSDGGTEWFKLTAEQALEVAMLLNSEKEIPYLDSALTIQELLTQTRKDYLDIRSRLTGIERAVAELPATVVQEVVVQAPAVEEVLEAVVEDIEQRPMTQQVGAAEGDYLQIAMDIFRRRGKASTSLLQRELSIGYSRAARIIDSLEAQGSIGPLEGSRAREVLVP